MHVLQWIYLYTWNNSFDVKISFIDKIDKFKKIYYNVYSIDFEDILMYS